MKCSETVKITKTDLRPWRTKWPTLEATSNRQWRFAENVRLRSLTTMAAGLWFSSSLYHLAVSCQWDSISPVDQAVTRSSSSPISLLPISHPHGQTTARNARQSGHHQGLHTTINSRLRHLTTSGIVQAVLRWGSRGGNRKRKIFKSWMRVRLRCRWIRYRSSRTHPHASNALP